MNVRLFVLCVASVVLVACSNGGTAPSSTIRSGAGSGSMPGGSLTAVANGLPFAADTVSATVTGSTLAVRATEASGRAIELDLVLTASRTGTYAIAGTASTRGRYVQQVAVWEAFGATGGSGSVVITAFTSSRVAGAFSFVAQAVSGGAIGEATVTAGTFDAPR